MVEFCNLNNSCNTWSNIDDKVGLERIKCLEYSMIGLTDKMRKYLRLKWYLRGIEKDQAKDSQAFCNAEMQRASSRYAQGPLAGYLTLP